MGDGVVGVGLVVGVAGVGGGVRALAYLWDVRGGLRGFVNCRLGMRDAAVVVEERVDVLVHEIGIVSARILAPGVQRLVEGGGAPPALWRATASSSLAATKSRAHTRQYWPRFSELHTRI